MRVLFVEDHLELIAELVELLQSRLPEMEASFALDIPQAIKQMGERRFDIVILDVMLPRWHGVPDRDEGAYLAAWILGKRGERLEALRDEYKRPNWLAKRPTVVLLTSRTRMPLRGTWNALGGRDGEILIIERLSGDNLDHCEAILKYHEQNRA